MRPSGRRWGAASTAEPPLVLLGARGRSVGMPRLKAMLEERGEPSALVVPVPIGVWGQPASVSPCAERRGVAGGAPPPPPVQALGDFWWLCSGWGARGLPTSCGGRKVSGLWPWPLPALSPCATAALGSTAEGSARHLATWLLGTGAQGCQLRALSPSPGSTRPRGPQEVAVRCRGRRLLRTPGTRGPGGRWGQASLPPLAGVTPSSLPMATEWCGATPGTWPWHRQEGRGRSAAMAPCPCGHPAPLQLLPRCRFAGTQDRSVLGGGGPNPKPARPAGTSQHWGHPSSPQLWPGHACRRGRQRCRGVPPSASSPRAGVQSPGALLPWGTLPTPRHHGAVPVPIAVGQLLPSVRGAEPPRPHCTGQAVLPCVP